MSNRNRKATKYERTHAKDVIRQAFPGMEPIWSGHGAYGGRRAPRDHTISFRLRDERGRFRSNVVWLDPERLASLTIGDVVYLVGRVSGKKR